MKFIYSIAIYFYLGVIQIASFFNPKAKLWVDGRRNIFKKIKSAIENNKSEIIWFHCASLGEFEQGRPLIEKIKAQDPGVRIMLTFFSPSGYEIRKHYSYADFIFYLPGDTAKNARRFIEIVKPKKAFFIKYEFWFNYLNELKGKGIPTFLISGVFREDQYFFKSYGFWFRKQLSCFTHFYLQDEQSQNLLNSIGFNNSTISGDTRFDRVFEIAKHVQKIDIVEQFIQDKKILIAGSSWEDDEKIISDFRFQIADFKLIIAPHEVDEYHIQAVIQRFKNSKICRYSQANPSTIKDAEILIIDNIGILSSLYQYGTIAFIGGGFGKGIHNILEAATFGLPLIFGPNYKKFNEAKDLINSGGAFSITNFSEFEKIISLLNDEQVLKTASHIAKYYVQSRVGATDKILNSIL